MAAVGDKGEFAISDRVLVLPVSSRSLEKPVANANEQATVFTQWLHEYKQLTREQANEVAGEPIKAIKVTIGSDALPQMPVKENSGLRIQNSIGCMDKVADAHSPQ